MRVYTKVGRLIRLRSEVGKTVDPVHVQWDNAFDSDDCIFKGIPEDRVSVADYSAEGAASSHRESSDRLEGCEVHGLRVHDCETDFLLEQTLGEGGALGRRRCGLVLTRSRMVALARAAVGHPKWLRRRAGADEQR